jgi:hypothetical protein
MAETKIGNATALQLLSDVNTASPQQKIYPVDQNGDLPPPHRENNGQILDGGVATLWKKQETSVAGTNSADLVVYYTKNGTKVSIKNVVAAPTDNRIYIDDVAIAPYSGPSLPNIGKPVSLIANVSRYEDVVPCYDSQNFLGVRFSSAAFGTASYTLDEFTFQNGKIVIVNTKSYGVNALTSNVSIIREATQSYSSAKLLYLYGYTLAFNNGSTNEDIATVSNVYIDNFNIQLYGLHNGSGRYIFSINRQLQVSVTGYTGNLIWYGTSGAWSQSATPAQQLNQGLVGVNLNNSSPASYTLFTYSSATTTTLANQAGGNPIGGFYSTPGFGTCILNESATNARWAVIQNGSSSQSNSLVKLASASEYKPLDGQYSLGTNLYATTFGNKVSALNYYNYDCLMNDFGDLYEGHVPANLLEQAGVRTKIVTKCSDGSFNLLYSSSVLNNKYDVNYTDGNTNYNLIKEISPNVIKVSSYGVGFLIDVSQGPPAIVQGNYASLPYVKCPCGVFGFNVYSSSPSALYSIAYSSKLKYGTSVDYGVFYCTSNTPAPSALGTAYPSLPRSNVYMSSGVATSPAYLYTSARLNYADQAFVGTSYQPYTDIPTPIYAKYASRGITGARSSFYQTQNSNTATFMDSYLLENQYFGYIFTDFFQLFGITYGFDGTDIFELTLQGGVINAPLKIAKAVGLRYLATAPTVAYFLSDYDNSIWTFNGGRDLQRTYSLNNFNPGTFKSAGFNTKYNELNIVAELSGAEKIIAIRQFGDTDTQTVKSITTVLDSPGTPATYTTLINVSDDYTRIVAGPLTTRYTYYPLSGSTVHPMLWKSAYFGSTDNQTTRVSQIVIHGRLETSAGASPGTGSFSYSGTVGWDWQTAHTSGTEAHPFTSVTLDSGGYFRLRVIIGQQTVAGGSVTISLPGTTYKATIVSCVLYISGNGDQLITDSI